MTETDGGLKLAYGKNVRPVRARQKERKMRRERDNRPIEYIVRHTVDL